MIAFQKRALRTLMVDVAHVEKSICDKVWCLNLDQIEPNTGRILDKQIVSKDSLGTSTFTFAPGTVLYSKLRPYLNKVVLAAEGGVATTELVPLKCNLHLLLPEYLAYYLRSPNFVTFASTVVAGAKMPRMVMSEFWDHEIPVPSLTEQRRIAAILDQADAVRANRQKTLVQLDNLAQSIFIEMFDDPVNNTLSCPRKSLKQLGVVKTGKTPPSAKTGMFGGNIPFITPGDLGSGELAKRMLTEQGAAESETVRAGATLVCCIGATIGKMDRASCSTAFNQQINAIEWHDSINDTFGIHVLRFLKSKIVTSATSTTLPILKKSAFEQIEIPVPPINRQNAFAQRIEVIEKLSLLQSKCIQELDLLFATLQHCAFCGEL